MKNIKYCIIKVTTIRHKTKYFLKYGHGTIPEYTQDIKNAAVLSKSLAKKIRKRIRKVSNYKIELIDVMVKENNEVIK